jgi:hypothetical protein
MEATRIRIDDSFFDQHTPSIPPTQEQGAIRDIADNYLTKTKTT